MALRAVEQRIRYSETSVSDFSDTCTMRPVPAAAGRQVDGRDGRLGWQQGADLRQGRRDCLAYRGRLNNQNTSLSSCRK
ncbi:hypothetical protein LP420_16900 [Massilia sp. B-10]|nr:hypothetical protein LP420_16900 [Massilia sp. B-10]